MSNVFFIADLHIGHNSITKYSGPIRGNTTTVDEHDEWLIEQWNSVVKPKDVVKVLGDAIFDKNKFHLFKRLRGTKHLVMGNHDKFPLAEYQKYFGHIHGFMKYKGFWLSHPPILGLRGFMNIHGHTHSTQLVNGDYICVSVEAVKGVPISLEEVNKIRSGRSTDGS